MSWISDYIYFQHKSASSARGDGETPERSSGNFVWPQEDGSRPDTISREVSETGDDAKAEAGFDLDLSGYPDSGSLAGKFDLLASEAEDRAFAELDLDLSFDEGDTADLQAQGFVEVDRSDADGQRSSASFSLSFGGDGDGAIDGDGTFAFQIRLGVQQLDAEGGL